MSRVGFILNLSGSTGESQQASSSAALYRYSRQPNGIELWICRGRREGTFYADE